VLTFLDDTDSVPWQFCHRILIRPHPAVWRLVHGLAVVYLVAITFLLFQNRDDARQFMKHLHPDLGVGKISG